MLSGTVRHLCNLSRASIKEKKLGGKEKIVVSQVASAILQQKLPPKQCDLGSLLSILLWKMVKKTTGILDHGVGINLMPYRIFKNIDLRELKPIRMSLQFADGSIRYPKGIIEDILVKVGGLIVPVDFFVLEVEDGQTSSKEHTILLGRPFMATTNTLIDVKNEKLSMTVLGETMTFFIFDTIPIPITTSYKSCSPIDYIDSAMENNFLLEQGLKEFESVLMVDQKFCKCHHRGKGHAYGLHFFKIISAIAPTFHE